MTKKEIKPKNKNFLDQSKVIKELNAKIEFLESQKSDFLILSNRFKKDEDDLIKKLNVLNIDNSHLKNEIKVAESVLDKTDRTHNESILVYRVCVFGLIAFNISYFFVKYFRM